MAETYRGNSRPDAVYRGSSEVSEIYRGNTLVWSAQHALIRSEPDYWYSMEDGAHYYNRGSRDEWLNFREGTSFANRGDYAYSNNAAPYIHVEESWEDGFTMAGWFHITAYGEWSYFFARGSSGSDRRIYVVATSASDSSPRSVALRVEAQGEGLSSWVRGPANIIPESGFFHLALTWRYSNGQNISNVYVNGVSAWEMSWDQSRPRLSFTPDQWVSYVEASPDTGYQLYANLDDIAMWSRPLAEAEIAAIHRDGPVPTAELEPAPPLPRYTASNSGGGGSIVRHDWNVVATHTVAYSAPGGGTWRVTWSSLWSIGTYGVRVLLNGSQIAHNEVGINTPNPQSVTIASRQLNAGDALSFEAKSTASSSSYRAISSWSWSLS